MAYQASFEAPLVSRDAWQEYAAQRNNIGKVALSNIQKPLTGFVAYTILEDGSKVPYIDSASQGDIENIHKSHDLLAEMWLNFSETYSKNVLGGIACGYIPPFVESRLNDALSKTAVRVLSPLMMDPSAAGVYHRDIDRVSLHHQFHSYPELSNKLLSHEITHKLSGGTFIAAAANPTAIERIRSGFTPKEVNEAVTEHVTQGILTGDYTTVDPDKRSEDNGTYYRYRKILAEFISRSQGVIDIKTITHAYFEDTGPEEGTALRRRLLAEATEAYGERSLKKLGVLMGINASSLEDFESNVLNRIQPPKIDSQGRVSAPGRIDISDLL